MHLEVTDPGTGVAGRVANGSTSVDLRGRLHNHGCRVDTERSNSDRESAGFAYRAQDRPGNVCSLHGFLYLEARTEGLRHR